MNEPALARRRHSFEMIECQLCHEHYHREDLYEIPPNREVRYATFVCRRCVVSSLADWLKSLPRPSVPGRRLVAPDIFAGVPECNCSLCRVGGRSPQGPISAGSSHLNQESCDADEE
jgi:hypothetical protein